jgi:hypothetical protein
MNGTSPTQAQFAHTDPVHDNRKRLEKCALSKAKIVWHSMDPVRRMTFVSLQTSVMWTNPRKVNILAKIVSALNTEKTVSTRNPWLYCNPVTLLDICDSFADTKNNTRSFVT